MGTQKTRKYKKPLKNCDKCRFKNFISQDTEKIEYCKIFTSFCTECTRKLIRGQ